MTVPDKGCTVVVTGATGFIAMHCILRLLQAGYRVRGTVRNEQRAEHVRNVLRQHIEPGDRLTFAIADLDRDQGWREAVRGCRFVLHVASPLPLEPPKDERALIETARDGALRVLRACAEEGVGRVVMTSSVAAVVYGQPRNGETYDERSWSNLSADVGAYEKSKTLAERAAWDYVGSLEGDRKLELVTINPGLVLGPSLGADFSTSGEVVRKLLARELPGIPNVGWATVDVRDVADAHLSALETPEAAGQRFIVAIEHTSMEDIARILADHYRDKGYRVPRRKVPDWMLRTVALWDKTAKLAVPELGKRQDVSHARAQEVLGWHPRPLEEMVVSTADSMIEHRVV